MHFTQDTLDLLDATLHKKCQTDQIPGMALVVSQHGKQVFEKTYGYRDVEKRLPVTIDTVFGVASITKSVVALAIMQLEDAKKLTVEDPVVDWLPELKLPNQTDAEQITIHHLLTHTAGFPGLDAVNQARAESIRCDPDGEYLFEEVPETNRPIHTVTDVMKVMEETDYKMLGAPGDVFNYSNESYALLQEIMERASGEDFITYVKSAIFDPLEMNRSMFLTEELAQHDNVTELYAYSKEKEGKFFHSPVWWDVGSIYSNGSLKASARDLMKYLEVYRLDGLVNGKRIVSETGIQKMITPQITLPNGNQYGYGLQVQDKPAIRFVGHGGSIKGVSSNIQYAQEKDLTICVVTNIADVAAADIAFDAMNLLLDRSDEEVLPEYEMAATQLKAYAGHYQSRENQELDVDFQDNMLFVKWGSNVIPIRPYKMNHFVTEDGKKFIFTANKQNQVTGVFRGMRWIPKG